MRRQFVYWRCPCCCCRQTCHKLRAANKSPKIFQLHSLLELKLGLGLGLELGLAKAIAVCICMFVCILYICLYVYIYLFPHICCSLCLWQSEVCNVSTGSVCFFVCVCVCVFVGVSVCQFVSLSFCRLFVWLWPDTLTFALKDTHCMRHHFPIRSELR